MKCQKQDDCSSVRTSLTYDDHVPEGRCSGEGGGLGANLAPVTSRALLLEVGQGDFSRIRTLLVDCYALPDVIRHGMPVTGDVPVMRSRVDKVTELQSLHC